MYLTLGFKNPKLPILETEEFSSLKEALEDLKKKYIEECEDRNFDSQEIKFIEAIYGEDEDDGFGKESELIEHEDLEEEWNEELERNRKEYEANKKEQRVLVSDYKANSL